MENSEISNKISFHNDDLSNNNSNNLDIITSENFNKNSGITDNKKQIVSNISSSSDEIQEDNYKLTPHRFHLYKFKGNSLFLFLDRYDNPLFIIGPHWPMYICLISTFSIIFLLLHKKLWNKLSYPIRIIGDILFWTFFISYTGTSVINPGYPKNTIKRALGIPRNLYYFCEHCKFYLNKNSYASHCYDCNICIEKYDHHCIWTGHCIGKYNLYLFYIFTLSIFCLGIYFILVLFLSI